MSQAVGPVEGVIPPTIKFFSRSGTYQDAISVTWQSVRGAAEYKLEMQRQGDEDWTRITRGDFDRLPSSSDNRFLTGIAKDLECGATYDFRIRLRGDGITFARQFGPYAETTVAPDRKILGSAHRLPQAGTAHQPAGQRGAAVRHPELDPAHGQRLHRRPDTPPDHSAQHRR